MYSTIQALYSLDRWDAGDEILFPILHSKRDSSKAVAPAGAATTGIGGIEHPKAYKGLWADGYMTLLAVLTRQARHRANAAPANQPESGRTAVRRL